jgi:hypothetical protein
MAFIRIHIKDHSVRKAQAQIDHEKGWSFCASISVAARRRREIGISNDINVIFHANILRSGADAV